MDIGDLIYYIVLLVFILAGALGKRKKKPQRTTPSDPPPATGGEWKIKNILEEFFEQKKPETKPIPIPAEYQQASPQPKPEKEKRPPLQPIISPPSEEGKHAFPKMKSRAFHHIEDEQPSTLSEILKEEHFDARKAVIYSAIINRPEF
ncbi:MAG: hypothetical protein COA57_05105 [Flavobacteriales bacterium]|nr:MAG: hypothetical protein COA57_05105 [Flavobacteriales bacterium]